MNWALVPLASPPASYEQLRANISTASADLSRRYATPLTPQESSHLRGAPVPKTSMNHSQEFLNLSRVEMTAILCFVRLTGVSIRPHVSVRNRPSEPISHA
jgi:hypothetical protein